MLGADDAEASARDVNLTHSIGALASKGRKARFGLRSRQVQGERTETLTDKAAM
jgi:hypothetical protein